jgi:hypothetical protein
VKAVHVKKCRAALSHNAEDTAEIGTSRKRVRIACDPCRKRKSRCDAATPCFSCRSTDTTCHYSSEPSSTSSGFTVTDGDAAVGDVDPNTINRGHQLSPPFFLMPQRGMESVSGSTPSLSLIQNLDQAQDASATDGRMPISALDGMMGDGFGTPLSQQHALGPFLEPGNMDDFWQTPDIVSTASLSPLWPKID